MSPELQALEALKNESLLHCKVVQQVDELSEKHVRDYDALREKQYQELVKVSKTSSVTSLQYVSIVLRKSRLHDSWIHSIRRLPNYAQEWHLSVHRYLQYGNVPFLLQ
jgi:hypothetical protein